MDHPDVDNHDATLLLPSTSDNATDTTNYDQNIFNNNGMYQTSANRHGMETHGEFTTSPLSSIVKQKNK